MGQMDHKLVKWTKICQIDQEIGQIVQLNDQFEFYYLQFKTYRSTQMGENDYIWSFWYYHNIWTVNNKISNFGSIHTFS